METWRLRLVPQQEKKNAYNKTEPERLLRQEVREDMRYKSFENFGVNVYEKGKLTRRKTFKKLDEAIEFARDMGSAGYTCKYVTLDEIGRVIDEL